MGRAIDLFVTYRFLRLLTTPFEKTDAYKFGIIDKDGNRVRQPKSTKPAVELATSELKNSYTILHKLVFNIKKLFGIIFVVKLPGALRVHSLSNTLAPAGIETCLIITSDRRYENRIINTSKIIFL